MTDRFSTLGSSDERAVLHTCIMGNCLGGPSAPPVVFTICPHDGKAHDFGPNAKDLPGSTRCEKCKQTKEQVDIRCKLCREDEHDWLQSVEAVPQPGVPVVARPIGAPPPPIPVGTPVQTIYTCKHCGLRRMEQDGNYVYDDYYMYGGGYMLGTDMMMFGMLYGASDMAYNDYGSYYGEDAGFGADGGFDDDDDFGGDFGGDF